MLTRDEAQLIGREYRDQFESTDAFVRSVQRWQEHGGQDTAAGLRRWLERDLGRDRATAGALSVVRPELSYSPPNGVELGDCLHCLGRGYVRRDVGPSHPDFGKALLCPACANGQRRCGCQTCSSSSSSNHDNYVDGSGHDWEHGRACPRCREAGAVVVEMPRVNADAAAAVLARKQDMANGGT
jgi:hypothetical protein